MSDTAPTTGTTRVKRGMAEMLKGCLLYTSDAADERSSVDLGGRRIIKKTKREGKRDTWTIEKINRACEAKGNKNKQ